MEEKQKIFGYARTSTREQNEDRQIIALKEMGVPEKNIFLDKLSGKNFERPQYKKIIRKLDNNSVLYIKSIVRLGRSYRDFSDQWRVITKEKGADVVVIDMTILDTRREKNLPGTFISDLILALLSYVAESEYRTIHQRQAEGIAAAKARGYKFGRPPKQLPENFHEVYQKWKSGKISVAEAVKECNMPRSTFYYKGSNDYWINSFLIAKRNWKNFFDSNYVNYMILTYAEISISIRMMEYFLRMKIT